ncbi:MAG: hypothetical protein WC588_05445 [Candidatus Micrarchaeia archaeon]
MRFVLHAFVLILAASTVFAQGGSVVDSSGCASGMVEDPQCAAQCCGNNGGQYSFAEHTCTVASGEQSSLVQSCKTVMNCCKPSAGNPTCSSGAALVLAALAACAIPAGYACKTRCQRPRE